VLYIAQQETDEASIRSDDVADALKVPRNYLSKILHSLAKEGLLWSVRGPGGGFRMRVSPHSLQLYRVIQPFDDIEPRRTCLLGRPQCSDRNPCAAHEMWKGISEQVGDFLRQTTIADLIRGKA
jgi:Rrf2 family transcriptional regulator, iron-sulfur cluster assembly transcription factor